MSKCSIHNVEMNHYSNDRGEWDSHKLQDGTWCNGQARKVNPDVKMLSDKLDKVLELLSSLGAREAVKPSNTPAKDLPF